MGGYNIVLGALSAGTNYALSLSSKEVKFNIIMAKLVKPTADTTIFVYGGEQTYAPDGVTDLLSVINNKRIDAGTQTVTVSLRDKVNSQWTDGTTDDLASEFTTARKSIEGFTTAIGNQAHTGPSIIPEFEFRDGDVLLVKGVDYLVEAADNIDEGTATATFQITKEAAKPEDFSLYIAIAVIIAIATTIALSRKSE